MLRDEGTDVLLELTGGAMDTSARLLAGKFGEAALDQSVARPLALTAAILLPSACQQGRGGEPAKETSLYSWTYQHRRDRRIESVSVRATECRPLLPSERCKAMMGWIVVKWATHEDWLSSGFLVLGGQLR